jgi:xylulokinase
MSILTVDVGTSSLKAVLYANNGRIVVAATRRYGYRAEQPGWAEADPEAWWQALRDALAELVGQGSGLETVEAISFTGQMHTAVLLDAEGQVIPPTILWLDRRAEVETEELRELLHLPPYQLNSTFTLPKLLWLHRHRPEVLARTRTLLWPKDYLRFRLTGEICTDLTEPGGAVLLEWASRAYAVERLALAGLGAAVLPPIRPASGSGGSLRPQAALELGLPPQARVVVGMGDVAALFGAAPLRPGRVVCSLGSSSMVFAPVTADQAPDPAHRLYIYPFGPCPMLGGVSSTTGSSLAWAHATFSQGKTFEACVAEAVEIAPGAEGVCFIPYLAGERTPFWNDLLRGGFYGLQLAHDGRHLTRAVMEGVAFSLRDLLNLFGEMGIPLHEIALAGGGARTSGWSQIIADVCQLPVLVFAGSDTVTRVLFALSQEHLGRGTFDESLVRTFDEPLSIGPRRQLEPTYDEAYRRYRAFSEFALRVAQGTPAEARPSHPSKECDE